MDKKLSDMDFGKSSGMVSPTSSAIRELEKAAAGNTNPKRTKTDFDADWNLSFVYLYVGDCGISFLDGNRAGTRDVGRPNSGGRWLADAGV